MSSHEPTTARPDLAKLKMILDVDNVQLADAYETGPDLDRVRKWHERDWRTWMVVTDGTILGRRVVYVLGSQNRCSDWRKVRYFEHWNGKEWLWKCETVVGRDDVDLVMQSMSMVFVDRYPEPDRIT